ncbi:ATP-binding protein [Solibacillus daqui]|uniref:ATP-binding protein n=1 Tax=Solibacillus daqui TaxID=2912187 RepID=UPI002365C57B|nr:ATP-binding protein [Solibacillus daqui]
MEGELSHVVDNLFQQANEHMVIFDCAGKIKYMNGKVVDTFEQLNIQTNFFELTENNNAEWNKFITRVTRDATASYTLDLYKDFQQNVLISFLGYYIPERQLVLCILQFNTVHKPLNETQHNYHLINGLLNGVVLTSKNGKIIMTNPIALQLLGFDNGQLERRSYDLLFENCYVDPKAIIQYYRMISNNELATILVKRISSDDQVCYLNISSKIDETLDMLVTTITDQTEKMILLETINHQKSLATVGQSVATIIHEIRNPMTTIQGFIQMIKSSIEEQVNPYFQIVETELQRIDDMLLELLSISKPKKYDFHLLDFKGVIEQAITLLQLKALESNVNIIFEYDDNASFLIKGNYNRLKQMLINLLKNAIEAVETNGSIIVRLLYTNASTLRLIVEDTGKGMSTEQLANAFQSFYSTKSTGTGLGLVLVQTVVEEHNGTIFVESSEGVGSRFKIDINLLENEGNPSISFSSYPSMQKSANIYM